MAKLTYIFHVIGTLTMRHVELALESLRRQQPFHWDRFVLYNASALDTEAILALVPRHVFDQIAVEEPPPGSPPTCSFDWLYQMQQIGGADRYLVHKADFYLPPWTCREFERVRRWPGQKDFVVLFNKWDMKSRATDDDIRRFATLPWSEGLKQPDRGTYHKHLGKVAIPFVQVRGSADGVMHGYTDGVRPLYEPTDMELRQRWGVAVSWRILEAVHPRLFHRDAKFFAVHMWHESPDRCDWNKNMSPEERF